MGAAGRCVFMGIHLGCGTAPPGLGVPDGTEPCFLLRLLFPLHRIDTFDAASPMPYLGGRNPASSARKGGEQLQHKKDECVTNSKRIKPMQPCAPVTQAPA